MNPENSMAGKKKKNVVIIACCCVRLTVEMKSPIPSVPSRNSAVPSSRSAKLPRNGISNQKRPTADTSAVSTKPTTANGAHFPRMNSTGRIGVTMTCSIVPVSFSRTIAMLVSIRPTSITSIAMIPGT